MRYILGKMRLRGLFAVKHLIDITFFQLPWVKRSIVSTQGLGLKRIGLHHDILFDSPPKLSL